MRCKRTAGTKGSVMMKKKLFLTMAAILLLCVGVITVYAVGQPADAEPAQAAG